MPSVSFLNPRLTAHLFYGCNCTLKPALIHDKNQRIFKRWKEGPQLVFLLLGQKSLVSDCRTAAEFKISYPREGVGGRGILLNKHSIRFTQFTLTKENQMYKIARCIFLTYILSILNLKCPQSVNSQAKQIYFSRIHRNESNNITL